MAAIALAGMLWLGLGLFPFRPNLARADDATQTGLSPEVQRQEKLDRRAALGLEVSGGAVQSLLNGEWDVGTELWGIPMTAAEEAQIDLSGRMAFANALDRDVMPYLRSLPSYAGLWIDQLDGGGATVMLTKLDNSVMSDVRGRLPDPNLGLRFVMAEYTEKTLEDAVELASGAFDDLKTGISPSGVGVDTVGNRLTIYFYEEDLGAGARHVAALSQTLGVPVVAVGEPHGHDTNCTGRSNCDNPLRGGIRITRGSPTDLTHRCTLGFAITIGTDNQFLTAGHCGWNSSQSWYHPGLVEENGTGAIGGELATLYAPGGRDVMRVQMANSQASESIFGMGPSQETAGQWGDAVAGEELCYSGAEQAGVICGHVATRWRSWISETANYQVWGGDMDGFTPVPGDSGAPLFRRTYVGFGGVPAYWLNIAIGISTHQEGYFAWVKHAIEAWGGSVFDG